MNRWKPAIAGEQCGETAQNAANNMANKIMQLIIIKPQNNYAKDGPH